MMTENAKVLYSEFKSYQTWYRRRQVIENSLYKLEHDILGLKAISYDGGAISSSSAINKDKKMLAYLQRKSEYQNEIMRINCNMIYITLLLDKKFLRKADRELLNDVFIKGKSFKEVAQIHFYSEGYVYDLVYNLVEKINTYLESKKFVVKEK